MEIKTLKELREVLNYERTKWKIPQVKSLLGWMKTDMMMLFLHPGSPYQMMYCIRCMESFGTRKSIFLGGKSLVYRLLQYFRRETT